MPNTELGWEDIRIAAEYVLNMLVTKQTQFPALMAPMF